MSARMFKVLWQGSREELAEYEHLGCPREVPWSLLAPHEAQAQWNHSQSLERLNERGGLSPWEMLCVIEGRRAGRGPSASVAIQKLLALLAAHKETK